MAAEKKTSPNVESRLRHNILKMPQEVYCLLYTSDAADE